MKHRKDAYVTVMQKALSKGVTEEQVADAVRFFNGKQFQPSPAVLAFALDSYLGDRDER